MTNNSNDENVFIFIAVIVFGMLALGVWKFSGAINVNFDTGLSVLLRTAGVLAFCIVLMKFDVFTLGQVFPALLAGLVLAFFPALDYWAANASGEIALGFAIGEPAWYVRWYSKGAFVLLPSLGGYGFRYALSR